jgi:hypothetical protein
MDDDADAAIRARLEAGREERRRRRRTSKRMALIALLVLLISVGLVPDESDWLRAALLGTVVVLHLLSAVVLSRGDEAARRRIATVSTWTLVGFGVTTFGVGLGYSLAGEPVPADLVVVGPLLAGMVVFMVSDVPSGSDPTPTVWDEWESRARR